MVDIFKSKSIYGLPGHWPNEYSVHKWSVRPGFNSRSSHTKDSKKWYLLPPSLTLSIIRYGSMVKWSNPGNGVGAIEKGTFGSPLTKVANFTYGLGSNYDESTDSRDQRIAMNLSHFAVGDYVVVASNLRSVFQTLVNYIS